MQNTDGLNVITEPNSSEFETKSEGIIDPESLLNVEDAINTIVWQETINTKIREVERDDPRVQAILALITRYPHEFLQNLKDLGAEDELSVKHLNRCLYGGIKYLQ